MGYVSGIRLLLLVFYATGTATKSLVQGAPMVVLKSLALEYTAESAFKHGASSKLETKSLTLEPVGNGYSNINLLSHRLASDNGSHAFVDNLAAELLLNSTTLENLSPTLQPILKKEDGAASQTSKSNPSPLKFVSKTGDGNYKSHHHTVTELITETSQPISIISRLHLSSPSAPSLPEPRLTLTIPTSPHALQSVDLPTENAGKFSRHGRRMKRSHLSGNSNMRKYPRAPANFRSRDGRKMSSGRRQPARNNVPQVPTVLPKPPLLRTGPPIQQQNYKQHRPVRQQYRHKQQQQRQQPNRYVSRSGPMSKTPAVKRRIVPTIAAQTQTGHRGAQRTFRPTAGGPRQRNNGNAYSGHRGGHVTPSPRRLGAAGWAGTTTESALGPLDRINTTDVPEEIEAHPDKTPAELARDLAEMNPGLAARQRANQQNYQQHRPVRQQYRHKQQQQRQQPNMYVSRSGTMPKTPAVKRRIVPPFAAQTQTGHRGAQPTFRPTPGVPRQRNNGNTYSGHRGGHVTPSPRRLGAAGWAGTTTESALGPLDRINTTDVPEEIEAHPDKTPAELARDLAEMNPGLAARQRANRPQQTAWKPPAMANRLSGRTAPNHQQGGGMWRGQWPGQGQGNAWGPGVSGGQGSRQLGGQSGISTGYMQHRTSLEEPGPATSRYERMVEAMDIMEVGESEASWLPAWMTPRRG